MAESSEKSESTPAAKATTCSIEERSEVDLEALAKDFAALLRVDTTAKTKEIESNVEDMLARLDEYYHLLERMRGESANMFNSQIPDMVKKCDELKRVFKTIDQLEGFLFVVKKSVDEMEAKVQAAEKELLVNPVKRMMKKIELPSFLTRKKPYVPAKPLVERKWDPPLIFSSDEYFGTRKGNSST